MQHPDETLGNIRLENEIKHLEHTLETYVYSHCNMCNILIYFCNIKMKYLQHPDETSEIFETYSCKIVFFLGEWRHAGVEVDGGAWTSLCGSGMDNSLVSVASHKSRPLACLLEHPSWRQSWRGGSVVEADEADWARWEMRH